MYAIELEHCLEKQNNIHQMLGCSFAFNRPILDFNIPITSKIKQGKGLQTDSDFKHVESRIRTKKIHNISRT